MPALLCLEDTTEMGPVTCCVSPLQSRTMPQSTIYYVFEVLPSMFVDVFLMYWPVSSFNFVFVIHFC